MNGIDAVGATSCAAFAVNSEGSIVAWNEAAERSLGHRRSDVVGRRCWSVLKCRGLSFDLYCDESCPVRKMAFHGEPIRRAQMFFGLIDRARIRFHSASGEMTQVDTSTFMVQGEAGERELLHLL